MIGVSWDVVASLPDTWEDATFNTPETTWEQIFNSYQLTDPSFEVVTNLRDIGSCSTPDSLPTIVVYDTSHAAGDSEENSSENTNIIRLLNNGCHISTTNVTKVSFVFEDNSFISSQNIPAQFYWDDWFIYMQLGKNDLWEQRGDSSGFFRVRLLVNYNFSNVHYYFGFMRIKLLLGGEIF